MFAAVALGGGWVTPPIARAAAPPWFAADFARIDTLLIEGHSAAAESLADDVVARADRHARHADGRFVVLDSLTDLIAARTYPYLALRYGTQFKVLADSVLPPDSPERARMLRRQAILLFSVGDLETAATEAARGVDLAQRLPGISPAERADFMETLGGLYGALAVPDSNRALLERCLAIRRREFGVSSFAVAKTLATLADVSFRGEGNYALGLATIDRAIVMAERAEPGHPDIVMFYNLQGVMLGIMHDVTRARETFRKCVDLAARAQGTMNHRDVARFLNNVGCAEYDLGRYTQARAVHDSALAIRTLIQDTGIGESLFNLGQVAMQTGRFQEAESLYARSLRARFRVSPGWTALVRSSQFTVELRQGHLAEAAEFLRQELEVRNQIRAHPEMIEAQFRRALLYQAYRDSLHAFETAMQVDSLDRVHFDLSAPILTERQVLAYWDTRPAARDLAMSLAPWHFPAALRARLWDAVVRSRGQVCEEMIRRRRVIAGHSDTTAVRLRAELVKARASYGSRLSHPLEDGAEWDRRLVDARERIEQLEGQLALISLPDGEELRRQHIGLTEVRGALPRDAALVAFVLYRHLRPAGSRSDVQVGTEPDSLPRYAAFIQPAGGGDPVVLPLGMGERVDSLVLAWRSTMVPHPAREADRASAGRAERAAGQRLRRAVWDPLTPWLTGARTVFLVPDGMLALVNFAALPDRQSGYLIESAPILHTLLSERDLYREADATNRGRGLLLVASPDFDMGGGDARGTSAAVASGTHTLRGLDANCLGSAGLAFRPLPASEAEGLEVLEAWRTARAGEETLVLMGRDAGEHEFKVAASGRRVLHLATHGFFLNARCSGSGEDTRSTAQTAAGHPLRLAGLALAGANRAETALDDEDGILTAEEVSSMDLSGVEWVVLSACDTGLGDARAGEGIFGLRRALAVAGVGTTIMSLWPAEDFAARQWMKALYRARLQQNCSTAESVRRASLDLLRRLRARRAYPDPSLWASFVACGDWR